MVRYVLIAIACLTTLLFLIVSIKNLTEFKQFDQPRENDGSKE